MNSRRFMPTPQPLGLHIVSAQIDLRKGVETTMSALGVRRDKAALSSGCKPHPATAPAGSNRSSHGGNEVAEAFRLACHDSPRPIEAISTKVSCRRRKYLHCQTRLLNDRRPVDHKSGN